MTSSPQITLITIFYVKKGVILENLSSSTQDPAAQAFFHLTNKVKIQNGFIRQFWGHQVENPELFIWAIDWKSRERQETFFDSEEYKSLATGLGQVVNFSKSVARLWLQITDNGAATTAMKSGVIEVSFFIIPKFIDQETKKMVEARSLDSLREVETIGNATGSTIGWVIDAMPKAILEDANSTVLYGVFGYASIDVHMKWRETPEAQRAGKAAFESMKPVTVIPGVSESTDYFHVHFQEGS